jgi:asparagine synthase (glutamine-hydrolysing)
MCGIAGLWSPEELADRARGESLLGAMAATLHHRGPDDQGVWIEPRGRLGLAHRRLSIIDLSPEGRQPMLSDSGRFAIVFNGEIYNYRRLRAELQSAGVDPSRGSSDTGILLACLEHWGLAATLQRLIGMFAFAVWDTEHQQLTLARDRLGIKPLYYGWVGARFVFASEMKPFRVLDGFSNAIDQQALALYLRHAGVPASRSIYDGIHKLPPGCYLDIAVERMQRRDTPAPTAYWSAQEVARRGLETPFDGDDAEALESLEGLLLDAIGLRTIADVPLGAFLSGGVDSSTVVALMQAQTGTPVKTFSIGFSQSQYNEAKNAAEVARHLGTHHTELYLDAGQAQAVISELPQLYDEPFADSSQIPSLVVSRLARQHVTVALSGDGGDELFAGYNRHTWGSPLWRRLAPVPRVMRAAAGGLLRTLPPSRWDALFTAAAPLLPRALRLRTPGDKLHKLAGLLGARDEQMFYRRLVSIWSDSAGILRQQIGGVAEPLAVLPDGALVERMMLWDQLGYLPTDILTKVDRASMGVSLEARVPLLDHRVVEFAWRLPLSMKLRDGQGKWLLRQLLYRHVPKGLIERPKMGFAVPLDQWLRGGLRDWAESLLDVDGLGREGFFDVATVRRVWQQHLDGSYNHQHRLWCLLMFQAWYRQLPS